jgi:hypothetical protein
MKNYYSICSNTNVIEKYRVTVELYITSNLLLQKLVSHNFYPENLYPMVGFLRYTTHVALVLKAEYKTKIPFFSNP